MPDPTSTTAPPRKRRPALKEAAPSETATPPAADGSTGPASTQRRLGETLTIPAGATAAELTALLARAKAEMTDNNSLLRRYKPILLRRNSNLRAFCTRIMLAMRTAPVEEDGA